MEGTRRVGRVAACALACGLWAWACGGGEGPGLDTQGPDVPADVADPGTDPGDPDEGPRPDVPADPGTDEAPPPDVMTDEATAPACREGEACDDGDPCTFGDACDATGQCAGTAAAGCDDGLPCTEDACTAPDACTHAVKPGRCLVDGSCYEDGDTAPGNACQACVSALLQDGFLADDSLPCDDGSACTKGDACHDGACVPGPEDCADGNACTSDTCTDGQCVNAPTDGATCDDGNPCTLGDACGAGTCTGTPDACDDGNACTDDSCDARAGGCVHAANALACGDGNACTTDDACADGACRSGTALLACDDDNPCTDDGCVPSKGCVYIPNAAGCDDGDPCTVGDTCRRAACEAGTDDLPCDDANACTDDACVAGTGCVFTPNTVPCSDDDPCTVGDTCGGGGCVPGAGAMDCNDGDVCTDDACTPGEGCTYAFNTAPCEDDNVCTHDDLCQGDGTCKGTAWGPDYCDDGMQCTVDSCNAVNGCTHRVDNRPECRPQIVIDFPPRGATLDAPAAGPDGRTLTVQGHVETGLDGWFVTSLSANGQPLLADPVTRAFSFPMESVQGMNAIVVDAEDLMGLKDHVVQSYYFSHQWYPVDQSVPEQSQVKDGLVLFLGPEVWDDNDTSDVDDIATIMTLFLQGMDLGSMIPRPATSGSICLIPNPFGGCITDCDYRVYINNVRYSSVSVDLAPMEGGLDLGVAFYNFAADIDIDGCGSPSGTVTASSIRVNSDLLVSLDPAGTPVITMANTQAVVNGLDVSLDGVLGFLTNWLVNFFEGSFTGMLEDAIEDQIAALIPSLQEALAGLAINTDFDVPAFFPGGNPVSLGLRSKLSTIEFHATGGTVGLAATVVAPRGVAHDVLGSIGRASCLAGVLEPKPSLPAGSPVPTVPALEMALHDDFFNQIPFALFFAGSLTLPVPADMLGGVDLSSYGITDLSLFVDLWLPPILSACNAEQKLMLQMGDVGVRVDMTLFGAPVQMQLYATMEAEASLEAVDGEAGKELAIAVQQPTFIDVEIASLSGGLVGAEETLGTLIRTVLMPELLGALTGETLASFPIPEFDLSGMMEGLPPDTKLSIDIREVLRLGAYNIVSGNVK